MHPSLFMNRNFGIESDFNFLRAHVLHRKSELPGIRLGNCLLQVWKHFLAKKKRPAIRKQIFSFLKNLFTILHKQKKRDNFAIFSVTLIIVQLLSARNLQKA